MPNTDTVDKYNCGYTSLKKKGKSTMKVNKTQACLFILDILLRKGSFTKEDIFEYIEISDVTLRRYIQELRAFLCNFNNGKTIKYDYFNRKYYLDNE